MVAQSAQLQRRFVGTKVHRQQVKGGDAELAVVRQHDGVGERRVAAAQVRRDVRVAQGQAAHMGFVDHHARARDVGARRAEGACGLGSGDACLGGQMGVVARVGVLGRGAAMAEVQIEFGGKCAFANLVAVTIAVVVATVVVALCAGGALAAIAAHHILRPRVEQQLCRVEAVALVGCPRSMRAQAVHQSGARTHQQAVPDAFAAGGQRETLYLDRAGGVEQAYIDTCGVGRPHGKIHPTSLALADTVRPQRPGLAR